MKNQIRRPMAPLIALFALTACSACLPAQAAPPTQGTLLSFDFDTHAWPGAVTQAVGTIDVAHSTQPSGGLQTTQVLSSGPLALHNTETALGKLTLAFSLSASAAKPVLVRVTSFNAAKKPTGSLDTLIYPAAPAFYQRYALDLSTCKPSGAGRFVPNAPFVGFTFSVSGSAWQGIAHPQICLDNVNYASPAYYVSPQGSDANTGRTEKTAFATPQKGLNMAQPGDIVVLMDGTYTGGASTPTATYGLGYVAAFQRAGTPAAWIVLKNYPGQHPTLTSNGWNIVSIVKGSNEKHWEGPALAYLEIRGLHVRGEGDVAKQKYPDAMNKADSRTNTNGIALDGRYSQAVFHDIRYADNLVEYCPANGVSTNEADRVYFENNVTRYNSWTTIYGTSGISTLGASNFDGTVNTYRILVRNNRSYGNETREICVKDGRLTDGNGIIIDVNQHTGPNPTGSFTGRTLVQNNLCYDNGGSGIHTVTANHVDIINNTAYLNSAHKDLQYSEIFTYGSDDVRIMNNILVAPVADIAAGEKPEPVNRINKSTHVVFSHNIYFGGNIAPDMGEGDKVGDPQFVHPSIDHAVADFHLKSGSPALGKGVSQDYEPFIDIDGKPRHLSSPSAGAYEK